MPPERRRNHKMRQKIDEHRRWRAKLDDLATEHHRRHRLDRLAYWALFVGICYFGGLGLALSLTLLFAGPAAFYLLRGNK